MQAEFIILGQAVGVERHATARGRDPLQHSALDRARHPGQRQPRAKRLAYHEILAVRLRKLVGIMPRYEPRFAVHQRQDRQLHGGVAPDQAVDHAQFARMHHVLGIVQLDRRHANLLVLLIAQQRRPERVQAIGLGRRAIVRTDHQADPLIVRRDLGHGGDGRKIIGIVPT